MCFLPVEPYGQRWPYHHMGRPQVIRLLALLDRGHRELPIQPNYVGNIVSTSRDESVEVMLEEDDGIDQVVITRGEIDGSES